MTLSITGWTLIMGIASYYGIDFLYQKTDREGFLSNIIDLD